MLLTWQFARSAAKRLNALSGYTFDLYEYQAKQLFRDHGINVLKSKLCFTPVQVR